MKNLFLALVFLFLFSWARKSFAFSGPHGSATTSTTSSEQSSTTKSLQARRRWGYFDDDDDDDDDHLHHDDGVQPAVERKRRKSSKERPTLPIAETLGVPTTPSKPKIVVLGASGRIGSLVVKQLMEMSELDATIVAFVRDYDKACRVLYDDVLVVTKSQRHKGPNLQIVVGDLVPNEELPNYRDEDEELWLQTAQSAAKFYNTSVSEYDNRQENDIPDVNEALKDAIKGCTTIISCVGSVRPTNVWTDFVARPFLRLFRHDVSSWCRDKSHPYYTHFCSTRKAVSFAEREQLRREAVAAALVEEGMEEAAEQIPRIRIVRISDLCVTQKPWAFIPVLTNAFHSMVFRYQDMTERLLEESSLLDSVILRPGDLVDDERDVNTTFLQVDLTGKVPGPARVGREDVASLAIAAALFHAENATKTSTTKDSTNSQRPPLHLKLAVRWCGEKLEPYPAQGTIHDGLPDAHSCMNRVLKDYRKRSKRQRRQELKRSRSTNVPDSIVRFVKSKQRRSLKPYGVCVALPVYVFLGLLAKSLVGYIPGYDRVTPVLARAKSAAAALLASQMPTIRNWLQRIPRRGAKSFISF